MRLLPFAAALLLGLRPRQSAFQFLLRRKRADLVLRLGPIGATRGTLCATGKEIQDYIDGGKSSVVMQRAWKNLLDTLPRG
jgi:hypothetical protein